MSDERRKAITKILKCLALSKSANEHEAAIALGQAQALMKKHELEDLDILAAEASERAARSGAKKTPAHWEEHLAFLVSRAFGCQIVFQSGRGWGAKADWLFIGYGPAPEIAGYAFEVLYRQAKAARSDYIKGALKRCKAPNKTRRADLFSDGWVNGVSHRVASLATTPHQSAAIEAYVARRFGNLQTLESRDRSDGKSLKDWHYRDLTAGRMQGRNAQLHRGVGPADEQVRLPS